MRFPNAQKGVQNLYTAQILSLIVAICIIVTGIGIAAAAGVALSGSVEGGIAVGGVSLIFTIIAGILAIISFIIMLVGLSRAQKDDNNFRMALFCVLAGLILSVISTIISGSPAVAAILSLLSGIANVLVTFFCIKGIQSIADQLGDTALAARAQKLLMMIIIVYGVGVILNFVSGLLRSGTALTFAGILAILAGIVEIIAFFIYLGLLKRAKESFKA